MVSKAIGRFIRVAPRKARSVIGVIRGLSVEEAEAVLASVNKDAALPIKRLLISAIANAKRALAGKSESLYISKVKVDEGPMLKRFKAQAMGRATMIQKKTSHITIELDRTKGADKPANRQMPPKAAPRHPAVAGKPAN